MGKPKNVRQAALATDSSDAQLPSLNNSTHALQRLDAILHSHSSQFDKILQAILDTKTSLESRIDAVAQDVTIRRADHRKLSGKVGETESEMAALRPSVQDLRSQMKQLATEVATLQRRAEDTEGRSRRNSVLFMGFPERIEDPSAELFLEQ
ncbi:hypothetical protein NDU88_002101 [Pleurodeles waltl]|uniref:Uncharacterized protein n=1 Tax=Pleurodeles waltl TaxID=8319 RepID=A0AAV7KUE6_PLEWA|nr:hypothetical protein NDU88_002101 [Pleurodeles waltl]